MYSVVPTPPTASLEPPSSRLSIHSPDRRCQATGPPRSLVSVMLHLCVPLSVRDSLTASRLSSIHCECRFRIRKKCLSVPLLPVQMPISNHFSSLLKVGHPDDAVSPAKMCTVAYFTVVHCEYKTMQRNTQMGFVQVVKGHVKDIYSI